MKTEILLDKSSWSERGEWDNEPDKAQWIDEATGLQCLAVRARSYWCGYVGVPKGHQAFNKCYSDVDVDVHGGLTYASFCQGDVCHVPEPGQPDHVWWLGFDCAHAWDYCPNNGARFISGDETYRTLDYVVGECSRLAKQLVDMKG